MGVYDSNIKRDIEAINDLLKGVKPAAPIAPPLSPFSPSTLIEKIKSTGLIYSDDLIKRFAYALMTKPFVILSGLAGSGKTQLALAFAECMSEDVERQVRVVSVGADWTNREPLLGYPNALKSNEYVMPECGALDMLIEEIGRAHV